METKGIVFRAHPQTIGMRPLLIGGAVIALAIATFIGGIFYYTSVFVEHTAKLPGDERHFDPVASYDAVHDHAGSDTKLTKIEATSVRQDGTLDLKAEYEPGPRTIYTFYRQLSAPPENAPPLGAGSNAEGIWYEPVNIQVYKPWQFRSVRTISSKGNYSYQYFNLGMERDTIDPISALPGQEIPPPVCSFADLWKIAIAEGAPAEAVATIVYDKNGYSFTIRNTDIVLAFDNACHLIGRGRTTVPGTPTGEFLTEAQAIALITKKYTEFQSYVGSASSTLVIRTEKTPDAWYAIFQQNEAGSGTILTATCFKVEDAVRVRKNGTYRKNTNSPALTELSVQTCRAE